MNSRDILDAMNIIAGAMDDIRRTIDQARDSQGRIDGYAIDLEEIERYRSDYRVGFESLEEAYPD